MAPKTAVKTRSARARGLRTLQHQTLPTATYYAVDTEVWFRGLVLQRAPVDEREQGWATKDQVHDEAIAWFLERHRRRTIEPPPPRRARDQDVTFWLDSKLLERARHRALRDGIKLAQLIQAALTAYVQQYVSAELMAFRRRVQEEACRLYQAQRAPARRRRLGSNAQVD